MLNTAIGMYFNYIRRRMPIAIYLAFGSQWEPINKRLISAKLSNGNKEAWIIGAYAPTNVSVAVAKDEFYDQLHRTLRQVPLGDFNANINPQEEGCDGQVFGPYECSPVTTACTYLSSVPALLLSLPTPSTRSGLKTL